MCLCKFASSLGRSLSRSCTCIFLNKADLDMPFVRHATESVYEHRMYEVLWTDISPNSNMVDLSRCCLPRRLVCFN